MLTVVLAMDEGVPRDRASAVLETQGHRVRHLPASAPNPAASGAADVVVLDGDRLGGDLFEAAVKWRVLLPPARVVILGGNPQTPLLSGALGISFVQRLEAGALAAHVERVAQDLCGVGLTPGAALTLLGLESGGERDDDAAAIVAGSHQVDSQVIRAALHPFMQKYISPTEVLTSLLRRRILRDVERRFAQSLDGSQTARRLVGSRIVDSLTAARLLWALLAGGALRASTEPPLFGSERARLVALTRAHLRMRVPRIKAAPTYYTILDAPLDARVDGIHRAAQLLAQRYAPEHLGPMDLGELTPLAKPLWNQIVQARQALVTPGTRQRYDASLIQTMPAYVAEQRARMAAAPEAEQFFMRGQGFLSQGDARRAVPELAAAARKMPDNPDYEAYAGWARLLADGSKGPRRQFVAARERALTEATLLGRRPRPRAQFALGLLCEAAGDLASAKEAFEEALECNPTLAPARAALARVMGTAG